MTRFYCDRCAAEVESPDELIEIVVEGRERPNLANWTVRNEMCRPCFDGVKETIANLLGEETKKKSRRSA